MKLKNYLPSIIIPALTILISWSIYNYSHFDYNQPTTVVHQNKPVQEILRTAAENILHKTATDSKILNQKSKIINQQVPFTTQAPLGEWDNPIFQDGCEEASALMAYYWATNVPMSPASQISEKILDIANYQKENFDDSLDTSTTDSLKRILEGYFECNTDDSLCQASVAKNISLDNIIDQLYLNHLVIIPADGQKLGNPYFTPPGPERHNLVVKGYDPKTQQFITNDPGTKRGADYRYDQDVLYDAIRDYPTGSHEPIIGTPKNAIIISRHPDPPIRRGEDPASDQDKISHHFLFFGDLMLDRNVKNKIDQNGLPWIFSPLAEQDFFHNYNLVSANLEGAITNTGDHYSPQVAYDFAFSPTLIAQLKNYNFNFFNLANNHFTDQGEHGTKETRENLDALNINYAGCQDGKVGDCSYTTLNLNNHQIGLAGFSMVYSMFDIKEAKKIIEHLSTSTDLVIVNIHWGTEYSHQFDSVQQNTAHALVDSGADIIIGHHPHVVQGVEIYRQKPIFYSLGNFVFDQYFSPDTQEELAVSISLDELLKKAEINLYPLKSTASQISLMTDEKNNFLQKLSTWSKTNQSEIRTGVLKLEL